MKQQYPIHPRPSCHAVITRDGRVCLIKRSAEPFPGFWGLPGGAVELGETVRQALAREVREETGLEVLPGHLLLYHDAIDQDVEGRVRFHYVILFFTASVMGGSLRAGDDASEVGWFTDAELRELQLVPGVTAILEAAGFLD